MNSSIATTFVHVHMYQDFFSLGNMAIIIYQRIIRDSSGPKRHTLVKRYLPQTGVPLSRLQCVLRLILCWESLLRKFGCAILALATLSDTRFSSSTFTGTQMGG